jgi:hypothetical protein
MVNSGEEWSSLRSNSAIGEHEEILLENGLVGVAHSLKDMAVLSLKDGDTS